MVGWVGNCTLPPGRSARPARWIRPRIKEIAEIITPRGAVSKNSAEFQFPVGRETYTAPRYRQTKKCQAKGGSRTHTDKNTLTMVSNVAKPHTGFLRGHPPLLNKRLPKRRALKRTPKRRTRMRAQQNDEHLSAHQNDEHVGAHNKTTNT